mmetsp:Transcript_6403/g.24813  ORF Transcript_6403/g.24813 Transcript_6403/m.24813 type:complete len:262 (+) Transcript_6403:597-1382(+)
MKISAPGAGFSRSRGSTRLVKCLNRASSESAMDAASGSLSNCCRSPPAFRTALAAQPSTPVKDSFQRTLPARLAHSFLTSALISAHGNDESTIVCRRFLARPLRWDSCTRMMSTPCWSFGSWLHDEKSVSTCCQFCIMRTSALSTTHSSIDARKSAADLPDSWSFVTSPRGEQTRTSDPKKSTYSRTDALVTLIPSLKWSSVLPRKSRLWSSGIHRPPPRRRLAPPDWPDCSTSSGSSTSESPSPKSSANRSSLFTASARP